MATRSMIAYETGSDTVRAIYCHHDGYPSHNGRILLNHYDDIEKVEELIDLGNLSVLSKEIGEKQDFDQPTDRNWCLAYGRDRGETGIEFKTFFNEDELFAGIDAEYFYVMNDGVWLVSTGGEWKVLSDAIREEDEPGFKAPSVTRFIGMLESV